MKMVISKKKYELPEEEVRLLIDKCKKEKIEFCGYLHNETEMHTFTIKEWFDQYEIKEGEE